MIAAGLDALPVHADGEGLRTTQRPVDHLGKRGRGGAVRARLPAGICSDSG